MKLGAHAKHLGNGRGFLRRGFFLYSLFLASCFVIASSSSFLHVRAIQRSKLKKKKKNTEDDPAILGEERKHGRTGKGWRGENYR